MLSKLIKHKYGLDVIEITNIDKGAGSNVYLVKTTKGNYVLKNIESNDMNRPEHEPMLLQALMEHDIPVARLIKTVCDDYVWMDDGETYHMQEFVEGVTYNLNNAPDWLMQKSAQTLGRIHKALESVPPLPIGIGEDFLKYMSPQTAEKSYQKSIEFARLNNDTDSINDLLYRVNLLPTISNLSFDLDRFSRKNTHGDYLISQLICGTDRIKAVIDWTSACVHPICWEIIRSFTYSSSTCKEGIIDIENFKRYIEDYLNIYHLNEYDLAMMPYFYFYQLSVCDYFNQYYNSTSRNRHEFLHQAKFSTLLLRWLEKNVHKLSQELRGAF